MNCHTNSFCKESQGRAGAYRLAQLRAAIHKKKVTIKQGSLPLGLSGLKFPTRKRRGTEQAASVNVRIGAKPEGVPQEHLSMNKLNLHPLPQYQRRKEYTDFFLDKCMLFYS